MNAKTYSRPSKGSRGLNISGSRRAYYVSYDLKNTCNYSLFYQLNFTVFINGDVSSNHVGDVLWVAEDIGFHEETRVYETDDDNNVNIDVSIEPVILLDCSSTENKRIDPERYFSFDCSYPLVRHPVEDRLPDSLVHCPAVGLLPDEGGAVDPPGRRGPGPVVAPDVGVLPPVGINAEVLANPRTSNSGSGGDCSR